MAFLTIHKLEGDPETLLKDKQEKFDPVINIIAPKYGAISSITTKTSTGLIIINLWESPEKVGEFMQVPEVIKAQQESHLPPPISFEKYNDVNVEFYQEK